jgi:hypothetical protein
MDNENAFGPKMSKIRRNFLGHNGRFAIKMRTRQVDHVVVLKKKFTPSLLNISLRLCV